HRLNTNENPYSLSAELQSAIVEAISKKVSHLNRYPDRDATELRSALAWFINNKSQTTFGVESIWAANGSNEILQSITLAFEGDALGFEPSYSMHPLITRAVGKKWNSLPRNPDFSVDVDSAVTAIINAKPGLVFLTTPNNPSGGSTSLVDIERIATAARGVNALLVVDEAYAEFSSQSSTVTLIKSHPNIVVTRTMSKAFAFAGARLGYLIADPAVVHAMLLIRLPYHLSDLTQAAAIAALNHQEALLVDVAQIRTSRDLLVKDLESLGMKVIPSDANFILFTGFSHETTDLWRSLVDAGILIRDVGIPKYLRITVGTESENRALIDALRKVL
ncbi:MAG: histidinol-phosphate transaminase, partial [Actinomycetota bacterium]